jgi:DNA-directed RNA polymerase specialized sigma24 family protein
VSGLLLYFAAVLRAWAESRPGQTALTRLYVVELVRRYSKQPNLWRTTKRLMRLLDHGLGQEPRSRQVGTGHKPQVHKLTQRLTAETVRALQHAYRGGASLAELQEQFGLSRGSVQRLLRERGVRRRRKSLSDADLAVLVERYEDGLTVREIAAEQGLAKTTVQDALARSGVAMRPAARRVAAE